MNTRIFATVFAIAVRLGIPWLVLLNSSAFAAGKESIREHILDERTVYQIPVGSETVTTISFPGPIAALDGASLTTDGKTSGKFQVAYMPGNYFFSVRSLGKKVSTNLNVVWNRKTYVLELIDSPEALLSVIFRIDPEPKSRDILVTPTRLLGMLDKVKAYPILKQNHPDAIEGIQYAEPNLIMEYPDFDAKIAEAFRFDDQDTIIFRLVLKNKTDHEIPYDPEGFSVRVGDRVYTQSISDASGSMPPKSETSAYFAITGTPNGGRNELSLKNKFTVIVQRASTGLDK